LSGKKEEEAARARRENQEKKRERNCPKNRRGKETDERKLGG